MAARIALNGGNVARRSAALTRPALGQERMRTELAFFVVHDVANRRHLLDRLLLSDLRDLLDRIARRAARPEPMLAHRDFHSRNLMWLKGGTLAVVDFQDALLAPPFYDLVSLVFDPYADPSDEIRKATAEAFSSGMGQSLDPLENPILLWVGLQRLLKAIGTFAFQTVRRGRTRFADHITAAERRSLQLAEQLPSQHRTETIDLLKRIGFTP